MNTLLVFNPFFIARPSLCWGGMNIKATRPRSCELHADGDHVIPTIRAILYTDTQLHLPAKQDAVL